MKATILITTVSSFCLLHSALLHAQGSLTPPGGPGATMLTLNQIEPRTPVDATHTGSGGSSKFLITQPGSYYLTTNVVGVSSEHGINISANNVTLDLKGFSLQGISGALDGIYIHAGYTNVTVRNGSISGWVSSYGGVEAHANNVILEGLNISANANGIVLESSGVVRDCNCNNNFGLGIQVYTGKVSGCEALNNASYGIYVVTGTVSDCDALTNGNDGIYAGSGTVSGCTVNNNTQYGIYVVNNSSINNCIASGNAADGIDAGNNCGVENCTSAGNGSGEVPVDGIAVGNGGVVRDCFSANNVSNGITAGNGCVVERCTAATNSTSTPFASGIDCGIGCVVEHCTATGTRNDGDGISCASGLISDCVASGNSSFGIVGSQYNCVVRNCQAQNNGDIATGDIGVTEGSTVSGCVVSEPYNGSPDCIVVVGDGCQIIGNTGYGGSSGVRVEANNCRIDGNHLGKR